MPKPIAAISLLLACVVAAGCGAGPRQLAAAATGGNIAAGKTAITHYGCGSCHTIRGIPGAQGLVGPPLTGIGKRYYVAGQLANTPENLTAWIRHPHAVNANTLMPELGVTPQDASDIAAFLYSLE